MNNTILKLNDLKNRTSDLRDSISAVQKEIYENNRMINKLEDEVLDGLKKDQAGFVAKCEELGAEDFNLNINKFDDYTDVSEDDGALFISEGKLTAWFIGNQDLSKRDWNAQATPILKAFGYTLKDLN